MSEAPGDDDGIKMIHGSFRVPEQFGGSTEPRHSLHDVMFAIRTGEYDDGDIQPAEGSRAHAAPIPGAVALTLTTARWMTGLARRRCANSSAVVRAVASSAASTVK